VSADKPGSQAPIGKAPAEKPTPPPFSTPRMVELEAEVVATRAQLASTVDELTDMLDPRVQAGRAVDSGKRLLHDAVSSDSDPKARTRARMVLGGAVAVVAVLVAARLRGRD
jgi:hypothetical protein